jgi:hypothetical protein
VSKDGQSLVVVKIICEINNLCFINYRTTITNNTSEQPALIVAKNPCTAVLSTSQKYKCAFIEAQKLATMASEVSMERYKQRLQVLRDLVGMWEKDKDASVINIVEEVTITHL